MTHDEWIEESMACVMKSIVRQLPPSMQQLLHSVFADGDGKTVPDAARALGLPADAAYEEFRKAISTIRKRLEDLLLQLPSPEQELAQALFLEGKTLAEAVEGLELSTDAGNERFREAVNRLREMLDGLLSSSGPRPGGRTNGAQGVE